MKKRIIRIIGCCAAAILLLVAAAYAVLVITLHNAYKDELMDLRGNWVCTDLDDNVLIGGYIDDESIALFNIDENGNPDSVFWYGSYTPAKEGTAKDAVYSWESEKIEYDGLPAALYVDGYTQKFTVDLDNLYADIPLLGVKKTFAFTRTDTEYRP